MNTIDFTALHLQHVITHHVGNKSRDEQIKLSDQETMIEEGTAEYLLSYFTKSFKSEEYYCFSHPVDLPQNDVFSLLNALFDDSNKLIDTSRHLAKLLYEASTHPNIKSGELNVVVFDNLKYNNDYVAAIGIYKSETESPFLKMKTGRQQYHISHDEGYEIKGLDKGALIINTAKEEGYKILIVDSANRAGEAQYWIDHFLQLKPCKDDYLYTTDFLRVAKNFVTQQMDEEYEVSNTDKIDYLNKSANYFKKNDSFEKREFEEKVLVDENVIASFRKFETQYSIDHDIEFPDSFDISATAVKKQSKIFKSVLKLDKNFHIYIHGDKNMIEKGVEANGQKFYKIYYKEEE